MIHYLDMIFIKCCNGGQKMNTLEKILEEIEGKIKFAEKIIVKPPCDKLDEIANDTAEAFIEAYKGMCGNHPFLHGRSSGYKCR